MSPLLLNLCKSMFSEFIKNACNFGSWVSFYFNNSLTKISHMSFADDIIIFGKATLHNVCNMLSVVDYFCFCSSQCINYTKSQVICGNNLDPRIAQFLFQHKGFKQASQDITWGFPLSKMPIVPLLCIMFVLNLNLKWIVGNFDHFLKREEWY